MYFASVELESILKPTQSKKSLVNLKIAGKDIQFKADTGTEATVIPYRLYKNINNKPLQKSHQPLKGWLAPKPTYPKGCIRLPTQYKNRKLDLLFLVVEGDFNHY